MTTAVLEPAESTALVPATVAAVQLGTLHASNAHELVAAATDLAKPLADIIQKQELYVTLRGRRHVRVEGWTTLAAMLGIVASEVEVTEADGVYTAVVELRRLADGRAVTRASAECGRDDELDKEGRPMWSDRPAYARRSMALTRATGKACRLAFSWVMTLAGYDPTPAEEMDSVHEPGPPPPAKAARSRPVTAQAPVPAASAPVPAASAVPPTIVVSVVEKTSNAGTRWYLVTFADGVQAGTQDEGLADQASELAESKAAVLPALKRGRDDRWFLNKLTVVKS